MLTGLSGINETLQLHRNSLPKKSGRNSTALLYYRSDYELKWLRICGKARKFWLKAFEYELPKLSGSALEVAAAIQAVSKVARDASQELDRWCERERILLRIPQPAAMKLDEKKARARGVNYLDITPSAPDVIHEANVPGEPTAQPAKRGPGRPPKQRPIEPQGEPPKPPASSTPTP